MSSKELENLVSIGKLKLEPPIEGEVDALRESGRDRLIDAQRADLSYASRFDLAHNAVHASALAALRRAGYLAKAHDSRSV